MTKPLLKIKKTKEFHQSIDKIDSNAIVKCKSIVLLTSSFKESQTYETSYETSNQYKDIKFVFVLEKTVFLKVQAKKYIKSQYLYLH